MPFCANCGAPVEGKFCAKCGTAIDVVAPSEAPVGGPAAGPPQPAAAAGGMTDNVASALCYVLGLLTGILFLVLAPYNQNKTIRFHAFQSIFLNVAWFVIWFGLGILLRGPLVLLWFVLGPVLGIGFFVLWLVLIIKTYQGAKMVLPVIGPIAEQQA